MTLDDWVPWWRQQGEDGLRRVLMESWDPIGVADVPDAADEYDSYVPAVGAKLKAEASVEEIARYLSFVRTRLMSLPPNPAADRRAADCALTWYVAATDTL